MADPSLDGADFTGYVLPPIVVCGSPSAPWNLQLYMVLKYPHGNKMMRSESTIVGACWFLVVIFLGTGE